jgi:ribonuclease P protein component
LIQQLFKEGKSFAVFPLRIIYLQIENQQTPLKAGFTVNSKSFKKAVDRNRIKRLMRETYRLQKNKLLNHLENNKNVAVFFIYTGKELPEYKLLFEKMKTALERLEEEEVFGNRNGLHP